jgi:hypothetical protein
VETMEGKEEAQGCRWNAPCVWRVWCARRSDGMVARGVVARGGWVTHPQHSLKHTQQQKGEHQTHTLHTN